MNYRSFVKNIGLPSHPGKLVTSIRIRHWLTPSKFPTMPWLMQSMKKGFPNGVEINSTIAPFVSLPIAACFTSRNKICSIFVLSDSRSDRSSLFPRQNVQFFSRAFSVSVLASNELTHLITKKTDNKRRLKPCWFLKVKFLKESSSVSFKRGHLQTATNFADFFNEWLRCISNVKSDVWIVTKSPGFKTVKNRRKSGDRDKTGSSMEPCASTQSLAIKMPEQPCEIVVPFIEETYDMKTFSAIVDIFLFQACFLMFPSSAKSWNKK